MMPKTLVAPLVAATLVVTGGLSLTSAQGRTLKDRFVGTWKLVNIETRNAKGEVVPPANPAASQNRTGYIIFDDAGYMAVTIMPLGRKKPAGAQMTDEERRAYATHIVVNGGEIADLVPLVDELWAEIRAIAKSKE